MLWDNILSMRSSPNEKINASIRQILDTTTVEWGVEVTLVELKDIQLPDSMKRAMAREAEAEREASQNHCCRGEARAAAALGDVSYTYDTRWHYSCGICRPWRNWGWRKTQPLCFPPH